MDSFLKQKETITASEDKAVKQRKSERTTFLTSKVLPAFRELKMQLEKNGRTVTIRSGVDNANITVKNAGVEEFNYSIEVSVSPLKAIPLTVEAFTDRQTGKRWNAQGTLRSKSHDYNVNSITKEDIIQEAIRKYKNRV